jgi:hypothetical protein
LLPQKDRYEVRSFLGLCTYCWRFIAGFVVVTKPLTQLTEEKQTFQWSPEPEAVLLFLKESYMVPVIGNFWPDQLLTQMQATWGLEVCWHKCRRARSM